MKILFITMALMLALVVWAQAAPFLVCDQQSGVRSYNLDIDGTITKGIPAEPDGSIHFDLDGMAVGPHIFKAQAIGQGGWPSDWTPPLDTVNPENPLNFRVSGE